MYEHQTFDSILQRMLDRVPANVDKREGSIIYDALAPAAAEIAEMYNELNINANLSIADTASGEYLTRRTAEFGVNRLPATKARRRGEFFNSSGLPLNVPIGSRYGINDLVYVVVSVIETGVLVVECETAGVVGNQQFGPLLSLDYINGLSTATLADVLVPGADEETDEALRERYYSVVNEPAFGGNIADYKQKIRAISGVGDLKVYPTWDGGGTVKVTIIASDWSEPTPSLIEGVQQIIDPVAGQGIGIAPIGHSVTIDGATAVTINVETSITLSSGVTVGQVQNEIEAVIAAYLLGLRKDWARQSQLIVRVAQIEARILTVTGVVDVNNTGINGQALNITLGADEVPELGMVALNA